MNIAIMGAGMMGRLLKGIIDETEGVCCVGMIEPLDGEKPEDITLQIDVIIDFSNPQNLDMIGEYVQRKPCGLVIATTGYDEEQIGQISDMSKWVPIVYTANFSLGITVMKKVLADLAPILHDSFDMEIIEKHHSKKLDAPSGTAKMLAAAMNPNSEYEQIYGRDGNRKREKEIGIHAVRGGTIAGEHTVIFAGQDEIIELTHIASSKKVFAVGAIKAAKYIYEKEPGLYDMNDVLFS